MFTGGAPGSLVGTLVPDRGRELWRRREFLVALVFAFGVVLLISVSLSGLAARTVLSTALPFLLAGALIGQGGFGLVTTNPGDPLVTSPADIALFTVPHSFTDVPVARALRVEPPDNLPTGSAHKDLDRSS